jgi:hypothetical protein
LQEPLSSRKWLLTERWHIDKKSFDLLGLEGTLFLRLLQPFIRVVDKGQENFSNITLKPLKPRVANLVLV